MADKRYKVKAGPSLPAGAIVNLSAAGPCNIEKVKDQGTGKIVEGFVPVRGDIAPGQEVDFDFLEHPDRLEEAVRKGHLVVVDRGEPKQAGAK